jgi:hypothetical protein
MEISMGIPWTLPTGYVNSYLFKMAKEIVSFTMKNGDFP